MRKIELTRGLTASVDNKDFNRVNLLKWYAFKSGNYWYAARRGPRPIRHVTLMHRFILNFPSSIIDHVNRDGLDNRRENIILSNKSKNGYNSKQNINNTSGYKGVCYCPRKKKWRSFIAIDTKWYHKYSNTIEEAVAWRKEREITNGPFRQDA